MKFSDTPSFPLVWVSYSTPEKLWTLVAYYELVVPIDGNFYTFNLPYGFKFDLASIPRIFWSVISSFELSLAAPLIHDYLYRYQGRPLYHDPPMELTRKQADRLFYNMMIRQGVKKWKAKAAYAAVRWFAPRW